LVGLLPFGKILFSPIAAWMMPRTGRKNLILVGYVLRATASCMLGAVVLYESNSSFLWITGIARFLEGVSDALVMNSFFSIMLTEFPDEKEKY
jgi:MFS family permease